jgi:hypothetical protein
LALVGTDAGGVETASGLQAPSISPSASTDAIGLSFACRSTE